MQILKDVDSSFCGNIPLHQTNLVQPQGVLLVINQKDLSLVQASINIHEIFGKRHDELINTSIKDLFAQETVELLSGINDLHYSLPAELLLKQRGIISKAASMIHEKNGCLHIEIELPFYTSVSDSNATNIFMQVQSIMSSVNSCGSVQEVANVAAKHIKALSGFDKVMIYSFDEEWIGSVIAEEMEPGMESYFGLRFPASDVPKQARDLYLKNPYRLIPNREYTGVPLWPAINPVTDQPTDLSDCKFRSVVSVHIEYLKNMNVMASMSTRIIHKEQLWGLIACHHRTPKYLSFQECSFFEFLSNIISSKIASLSYKLSAARERTLRIQYDSIIQQLSLSASLYDALVESGDELMMVFDADGIAVCHHKKMSVLGATPQREEIEGIVSWLRTEAFTKTVEIRDLPLRYEPAKDFAEVASGLLVLPIQPYEGYYILAFRNEVIRKVNWGGNPNQVLTFEKDSANYHPRNSFATWQETVRYTGEPWLKEQLEIAERYRVAIVELTLRQFTTTLEQKVIERTEELRESKSQLEQTYNELMQVLYVTSHDLNEPARKIQVFGSMLRDIVNDEKGKAYLDRILASGKRIMGLIQSLLHYSRLSTPGEKIKTELNDVVRDVLNDLELAITEKKAVVETGHLPEVKVVPDQVRQVFHRIIENSLKFSDTGVRITITAERLLGRNRSEDLHKIIIADTGYGFKQEYAEYIFSMFKKYHTAGFEGVGMGLTIARKIIEDHGGTITATSEENKGAAFTITLPAITD